jgi:hypothetical protein
MGNRYVPISYKTEIISGSTITDMQTYLFTNPTIFQLIPTPHYYPVTSIDPNLPINGTYSSQDNVVVMLEPIWSPRSMPIINTTWHILNCGSSGQDGIPIGEISTGRMPMTTHE